LRRPAPVAATAPTAIIAGLFAAGLRLAIAATITTAESTVRPSGTAGTAKAARTSRAAPSEPAKAAGAQHRRPQRGAFQLLALLGLERRGDRRKRLGSQHGDLDLELRDGISFHADRTFVVFFSEHRVQQLLLRSAKFFLEFAEFLAVLLRRFAKKLALFLVESKADARAPVLESGPVKVAVPTSPFRSARSAGFAWAASGRRRGRRGRRVRSQED
jgi:hypothetical protein